MKIDRLRIQNFKGVKLFELQPDGRHVLLTGHNEAGKSSVLDAIEAAIGGKKHTPSRPVRAGEEQADAWVVCGDFEVRGTWEDDGTHKVAVRGLDGLRASNPTTLLRGFCDTLAFDPLSFARSKPSERLATLFKLRQVDVSDLQAKRREVYETRRDVGRDRDKARAAIANTPRKDAPEAEVDIAGLIAQRDEIDRHNAERRGLEERISRGEEVIANSRARATELERKIAELQAQLESEKEACARHETRLEGLRTELEGKPLRDRSGIDDALKGAEEVNAAVRSNAHRANLAKQAEKHEAEYSRMSEEIDAIDADIRKRLGEASIPSVGLEIAEGDVSLDGVPFDQGSTARRIRASVAVGMRLNPRLRVMFVRDASLLDEEAFKAITAMAEEHDFQVWFELVAERSLEGACVAILEKGTGGERKPPTAGPVTTAESG